MSSKKPIVVPPLVPSLPVNQRLLDIEVAEVCFGWLRWRQDQSPQWAGRIGATVALAPSTGGSPIHGSKGDPPAVLCVDPVKRWMGGTGGCYDEHDPAGTYVPRYSASWDVVMEHLRPWASARRDAVELRLRRDVLGRSVPPPYCAEPLWESTPRDWAQACLDAGLVETEHRAAGVVATSRTGCEQGTLIMRLLKSDGAARSTQAALAQHFWTHAMSCSHGCVVEPWTP